MGGLKNVIERLQSYRLDNNNVKQITLQNIKRRSRASQYTYGGTKQGSSNSGQTYSAQEVDEIVRELSNHHDEQMARHDQQHLARYNQLSLELQNLYKKTGHQFSTIPMDPPQLLFLGPKEHITFLLGDPEQKKNPLKNSSHWMKVRYHARMAPYLKNLGLYNIARLKDCLVDKALITALIERWRPETNIFHLPFGEMTVTLEDASLLWGLPINGKKITGMSDDNWTGFVEMLLGLYATFDYDKPENTIWRYKCRDDTVTFSKFHIRLSYLRQEFQRPIPEGVGEDVVRRWTCAFCMDLFGSMMFPDKTGDVVPAMYLQLLFDLDQPQKYDWRCVVLVVLYRQLSEAYLSKTDSIAGPLLLLQMWSCTRLPVGRPRALKPHEALGCPDPWERHALAVQWTTTHRAWDENTRAGGVSHFRDDLEALLETTVNWWPYPDDKNIWPAQSIEDEYFFKTRGPLLFFWIIAFHPDRVMRQFGLYQQVPPPAPDPWEIHQHYYNVVYSSSDVFSRALIVNLYSLGSN